MTTQRSGKAGWLWVCFVLGMLAALSVTGRGALAQEMQGSYSDWNVYTVTQNGVEICYMASAPVKKSGNYSKRGEPYVLVTHRSAGTDEFSASSGYPYKSGGEVKAHIDGKLYKLFTQGELAWAYDERQDNAMVAAMKRGAVLTVRGVSTKGTYSEDRYSLKGFTKAHARMKQLCK